MIASDANNDGKITASDLVELRKLILGGTNTFNNKSWRLPKKLQNLDLTYPFPYTEGYSENPLMLPMQKVDFVAVKIGDINGNASGAQQNIVEPRSNKKLNFEVANVVLEPQERIYVPVYASNFKDIFGFQTTLKLKDAVFVDLIPEGLDIDATSIGKLNDDTYTLSYAAKQPLTIDRDKKLFTLVIDPKNSVLLEDILQLSSEITRSESYTSDLKVSGLSITFRNDVTAPKRAQPIHIYDQYPMVGYKIRKCKTCDHRRPRQDHVGEKCKICQRSEYHYSGSQRYTVCRYLLLYIERQYN